MNLTTCLRKCNPNVFRQLDPYTDPIYLQSPHRPQTTLSHSLMLPRSHPPHIYTDCQYCEDDPRTGAHYCRTCIEAQYYALQTQSQPQSQSQIQDMYINYATCECPHCDSGINSSTLTSRGYTYTGASGRYPNINMEPATQQLHNTGRYTHMPSSRLGRSSYRDVGLLGSGSCLATLGNLSGLGSVGSVGSMGSLGGLGGIGGVRDVRDTRNYGGRYGLRDNRLGLGYRL
ncbi:hypothetical protein SBOR_2947 [Sclerotinia borealis F-4128]|uniref:Uncharacterized protein n=1 Tax=Sclerotinia borealis (strain F-4128) TaxID=1432307 RepID=W9CKZ8_SCLBF|nr:hypothetical protein SBOR_2947 [Sclerotinia borealis F-4128]